jgi:integrase
MKPSALKSKGSPYWWISVYLGRDERGRQKRKWHRLPLRIDETDKAVADRMAETAHRQLRNWREHGDPQARQWLIAHDILEADAKRFEPEPSSRYPRIAEAIQAHPASVAHAERNPRDYDWHMRHVSELATIANAVTIDQLSREAISSWLATMAARGYGHNTRRLLLATLRRCSGALFDHGLHDPFRGPQLLLMRLESNPRAHAAVALGALSGLRPSEIARLRPEQIAGEFFDVGEKNQASVRTLPIPPLAKESVQALRSDPFAYPHEEEERLRKWLARQMRSAGVRRILPPKALRKSFATIAAWEVGVETRWIEAMMGHSLTGLGDIANRHYLAMVTVRQLQPVADQISAAVATEQAKIRVRLEQLGDRLGMAAEH